MSHKDAAEFVGVLLHSATATHYLHLNVASYAAHKALGHFYENIVNLADKWAEAYQGHYGIIPLDDFEGVEKGVVNAMKFDLQRRLLIYPPERAFTERYAHDDSQLALIIPGLHLTAQ